MAADLSAQIAPFATVRVAMDATAGNVTAVTLPTWCRRVTVSFLQAGGTADTGKIASAGTDGAAVGNNYFPVASGAAYSFSAVGGRGRDTAGQMVYLAGGTNSGFAHLELNALEGA